MINALKNKNFFLIINGKLISLMGNSIFSIAVMWYVLSTYKQNGGAMLALIMLMSFLPVVILGSLAGSIIDKYNKKNILIFSDLLAAGVVFIIFVLMKNGRLNSTELLGSTAILSVTSATVRIAVNSLIPELFVDKELYDANGANQFVERGTSLLGFAIGGGLIAIVGVQTAILINGISFVICTSMELFLTLPQKESKAICEKKQGILKDFIEVKTYLNENKAILRMVLIFTTINFFWDPLFNIGMPYLMKNTFKIHSTGFGFIEASLPLGFCIGALYFSKRPKFLLNRYVLFNSIVIANTILAIFSIPIAFSSNFIAYKWITLYFMFLLTAMGIFSASINISASVAIQKHVPESIRGKFMGISSSLSAGLLPLGSLIIGALIGKISPLILYSIAISAVFVVMIVIPKKSYSFNETALQNDDALNIPS